MKSFKLMLILCVIFFTPALAAVYFYKHPEKMHALTTNQGVFVKPMIVIDSLRTPLALKTEKFVKNPQLYLMLWEPSVCSKGCQRALDKLLRIRIALGRRFYEVDEMLLLGTPSAVALPLQGIRTPPITLSERSTLKAFSNQRKILIADRQGRVVLAFPSAVNAQAIYHDLTRLLTTNQA